MTLRFWDSAKGDGYIKVMVNGTVVDTIRLNADSSKWIEVQLDDLKLNKGDVITLKGYGNGCEYSIIDNIKLCPSEPEVKPGALEGRVFADANKDGIDNGEAGVAGVTVQLLDATGNVVKTATTGADGGYRFDGLQPGEYRVVFPTEVDGKVLTEQNVGGNDAIDSDANVTTGTSDVATVVAGRGDQGCRCGHQGSRHRRDRGPHLRGRERQRRRRRRDRRGWRDRPPADRIGRAGRDHGDRCRRLLSVR